MVELDAKSPCAGLLPVAHGTTRLTEVNLGRLTSLAPYRDRQKALSDALQKAYGLSYPAPNASSVAGDARVVWFGRDMVLLMGAEPDSALSSVCAVTDQTDAFACAELSGAGAVDVLARLVPVDLRPAQFVPDRTARTLLGHMSASITLLEPDRFLILVFRSMAITLVEEMQEAMEAVAAR